MNVGIIGCGVIGSAIARRMTQSGHEVYLHSKRSVEEFAKEIGAHACEAPDELIRYSDLVILSVKPNNLKEIQPEIAYLIREEQYFASCLNGISLKELRSQFPHGKLMRIAPNLPLKHGKGVIGITAYKKFSEEERNEINEVFNCLGKVHWFLERKLNSMTSLTGSGPAFILVMVEAMIESAIEMGFSISEAKELVYESFLGTLTMLEESDMTPCELKWQMASPAGNTSAGLFALDRAGIRSAIASAFYASLKRSEEIQKENAGKIKS